MIRSCSLLIAIATTKGTDDEEGVSLSKEYIPPAFQDLDEDGNPTDAGQDD